MSNAKAQGKTQIVAEPGTQQTEITRAFNAPPELLFRAYTEPDLLVQWLGPRQYTMTIDRYEVRDGGTWRYVHSDADGNAFGFHGVFHGTPSVDGIVQTFEFEGMPGHVCLETLTFEDQGDTTLVRTSSVYQSVADRDAMVESGMEEGINDGYDRLDELVAKLGRPANK
jgi:uncharacterized protein YndB with AHSA1/START domain